MAKKETEKKKEAKKDRVPTQAKKKQTRSTRKMTPAVFETICREIEDGHEGLKTICKKHNTSSSAFYDLLDDDKGDLDIGNLSDIYARAKNRQAEYLFDLQRETVFARQNDEKAFVGANHIQRDRLISDTIKWQASKLNPKKYGDKIEVDQKTEHTIKFK